MPFNPGQNFQKTSGYGTRINPFGGKTTQFHPGIDYAAPADTVVPAPVSGVVWYSGMNSGGYGNTVIIKASDGSFHVLAHMNGVGMPAVNSTVTCGQAVGQVGNTGMSTGAHLHYEIINAESPVNHQGSLGVSASDKGLHQDPQGYTGQTFDGHGSNCEAGDDFTGPVTVADPVNAGVLAAIEMDVHETQDWIDRHPDQVDQWVEIEGQLPGQVSVAAIKGGYAFVIPKDAVGIVADIIGDGDNLAAEYLQWQDEWRKMNHYFGARPPGGARQAVADAWAAAFAAMDATAATAGAEHLDLGGPGQQVIAGLVPGRVPDLRDAGWDAVSSGAGIARGQDLVGSMAPGTSAPWDRALG